MWVRVYSARQLLAPAREALGLDDKTMVAYTEGRLMERKLWQAYGKHEGNEGKFPERAHRTPPTGINIVTS